MAGHKMAFPLVIVFIFAVVGGVLSLVFSNFPPFFRDLGNSHHCAGISPGVAEGGLQSARASGGPEAIRDAVLLGYHIMVDTHKYAAAYVGNRLRCGQLSL